MAKRVEHSAGVPCMAMGVSMGMGMMPMGMGMGMGLGMGVTKTQPLRPKTIRPGAPDEGGGPALAPATQEEEVTELKAGSKAEDGKGEGGAEEGGDMMQTTVAVGGARRVVSCIMPQPFSMPLLSPAGARRRLSLPGSWEQFNDEQSAYQQQAAAKERAEAQLLHGFVPLPPGALGSAQCPLGTLPTGTQPTYFPHPWELHRMDAALRSHLTRLQHQNASLEVRQAEADRVLQQAEVALEEDTEAALLRRKKGKYRQAAEEEREAGTAAAAGGSSAPWGLAADRRQAALAHIARARKILLLGEGE